MRCPLTLLVLFHLGCTSDLPVADGIFADLGEPRPSATEEELATFDRGMGVMLREFSAEEGLGPNFNAVACKGCHEEPALGGVEGRYRDFLLVGETRNGTFTPKGNNGVQTIYSLEYPARAPTDPTVNTMATRHPIPLFGVGLLAEIPDDEILKNADEKDRDGDGISGRPNYDNFIGRFGRKAQVASLNTFVQGELFNHMGIVTDGFPPSGNRIGATRAPQPELSVQDLSDLTGAISLLAAPEPDEPTGTTRVGKALFVRTGCAKCHIPALQSSRGLIPLFSDLLIHDMGEILADGIIMGNASGSEFRTQPLWGVAAAAPYLHDGRATTLDEAIRLHGGEARGAREAYEKLSAGGQGLIVAFLESLGGRSEEEEEIPGSGEYGSSGRTLTEEETEQFGRGMEFFDRTFSKSEGLGRRFNGDACESCHFAPVLGGSGPIDVNVIRHGRWEGGIFTAPDIGTMAHRLSAEPGERPPVGEIANFFEVRQTPPLYGLGLIDQIDERTILLGADPSDKNQDGISGRANLLSDGHVGRLGWKANVPSLAEFARDAMSNELGMSVEAQNGLSMGSTTDDDQAADPEVRAPDLEDLVFFMKELAPPPRNQNDRVGEHLGELAFKAVGCAKCHLPSMTTKDGTPVPLYSDLLLHDVAPSDYKGIPVEVATGREFRTPPLWGLSQSAPYFHDGLSTTVSDAILRHEGEATSVRLHFEGLSAADKYHLLKFLNSL